MKRTLAMLLIIALLSCTLVVGASADAADTTFGIEPMSEEITLGIGYFSGAMHSLPFYLMDEMGWIEELGISFEYLSFTNGPVMMEANSEWDICSTGGPGAIAGILGYDVTVIGYCDEEASINMYVREDSPIAKSGQGNIEGWPTTWGTPDDWKGITVLLPVGTTAHQSLVTVLEQMGLTADDVTMQNMDVNTALTAFRGGQGDMIAVWTSTSIAAEQLGFVRAASSVENKVVIPTTVCATDASLADPVKREAIQKVWELYYRSLEWIEANVEDAATYYMDSCTIEGVSGSDDYDLCYTSLKDWFFPLGLEEMIELMTTTAPDRSGLYEGELGNGYNELFHTFDFFMSQNKYTVEQRNFIIDNNKVDSSIAEEVAAIIAAR